MAAVPDRFAGLIVPSFGVAAEMRSLARQDLPPGDVTVRVRFSSLNYKDALALTGRGKVLRTFPCVPGIDLAGEVAESSSERFRPGDEVLATGCGLGEASWGGFAEYASVRADDLIPVPPELGACFAMAAGTAGMAAALSVLALKDHGVLPGSGDILVTGAAGGVGSLALVLLSILGYRAVASTGRIHEAEYLHSLGAAEVIDRSTLSGPAKPLESARWAGAVDSVGGGSLSHILAQVRSGGVVAACGLAGGAEFATTVMPFILRSVCLAGINTVDMQPMLRRRAWDMIAQRMPRNLLKSIGTVRTLAECPESAEQLLRGAVRGRIVIAVE